MRYLYIYDLIKSREYRKVRYGDTPSCTRPAGNIKALGLHVDIPFEYRATFETESPF